MIELLSELTGACAHLMATAVAVLRRLTTGAPSSASLPPGRLLVLPMPDGQRVVAMVAGEADLESASRLHEGLVGCLAYRPRTLVVDATELSFCDLHGLTSLDAAVAVVERAGVSVTFRPSPALSRLRRIVHSAVQTSGQPGHAPLGCPLPLTPSTA